MLNGGMGGNRPSSLMGEYAMLLGDAVLRHRARVAEHSARIEAELANRVKSEFIANMSHELRTPLNTVIGFSKILSEHDRRRLPDKEIVEYSNLILDAATHLLAVINDILDISKIQSGKYALDAREIAIDDILVACLSSFKLHAVEAEVKLTNRIALDLTPVRGDSVKLRQIFTNLISNAIKFTPKGGTVAVEAYRRGDDGVTVTVRDTGIGMTAEEVMVALTPFGQVDGSRQRWREGTGLGLPIARALVQLHGGELKVQSQKGVGTEISVILPPASRVSLAEAREVASGRQILSRTNG